MPAVVLGQHPSFECALYILTRLSVSFPRCLTLLSSLASMRSRLWNRSAVPAQTLLVHFWLLYNVCGYQPSCPSCVFDCASQGMTVYSKLWCWFQFCWCLGMVPTSLVLSWCHHCWWMCLDRWAFYLVPNKTRVLGRIKFLTQPCAIDLSCTANRLSGYPLLMVELPVSIAWASFCCIHQYWKMVLHVLMQYVHVCVAIVSMDVCAYLP